MIGLFVIIFVILKINFILKLTYFLNQIAHTQARMKKQRIPAPPTVIALSVVIPVAPPASSARISISALASLSIFSASTMIQNYIRFFGLKVLILNFFAVNSIYRTFGDKCLLTKIHMRICIFFDFGMVLQIQISCEILRNETVGRGSHIRSLVTVFQMIPRGKKYQPM